MMLTSNALIVTEDTYSSVQAATALENLLGAAGVAVTSVNNTPADLSSYDAVYDIRYLHALTASEISIYRNFLNTQGDLLLSGEGPAFSDRNDSLLSLVTDVGGGPLSAEQTANNTQTVLPAFQFPTSVGASVQYAYTTGFADAGTGEFVTQDSDGLGSTLFFDATDLTTNTGDLVLVMDTSLLRDATPGNAEANLLSNIIERAATSGPVLGTPLDDDLSGTAGDDLYDLLAGDDVFYAGAGDDVVIGGTGDDTLNGQSGNDLLVGGEGLDRLSGGSGDDHLQGEAGHDFLLGNDGVDFIEGGTGRDVISGGLGGDSILGGHDRDLITGDEGDDEIDGGGGNDRIDGGDGVDQLDGGDGNDLIFGGLGNDTIFTGSGTDRVFGEAGVDTIYGQAGDDRIFGGLGNDQLSGASGNDFLRGGEGDDRLTGDSGNDRMIGGAGADTFVFARRMDSDMVVKFEDDIDTIELSSSLVEGRTASEVVRDFGSQISFKIIELDFGRGDVVRIVGTTTMVPTDIIDDIAIL